MDGFGIFRPPLWRQKQLQTRLKEAGHIKLDDLGSLVRLGPLSFFRGTLVFQINIHGLISHRELKLDGAIGDFAEPL